MAEVTAEPWKIKAYDEDVELSRSHVTYTATSARRLIWENPGLLGSGEEWLLPYLGPRIEAHRLGTRPRPNPLVTPAVLRAGHKRVTHLQPAQVSSVL